MLPLILATISTSFLDSFNPVGIAQQFVIQSSVKNKHHVLFYIVGMGLTNFLFGVLAILGLMNPVLNFVSHVLKHYKKPLFSLLLFVGIIFLAFTIYLITQIKKVKDEDKPKKIRSFTPISLFLIGVVATVLELSSALPYFAFFTVFASGNVGPFTIIILLLIYNLIYSWSLIALYLVFVFANKSFTKFYNFFIKLIGKTQKIIAPVVTGLIALLLIIFSSYHLFF